MNPERRRERIVRQTVEYLVDPRLRWERQWLRDFARRIGLQPDEVLQLVHRGGMVTYRVDRLGRVHIRSEYRCGDEEVSSSAASQ